MSYGSRIRSYDKGVVSGGGVDFRLRRITSSPSQTIRSRLVRTATDAAMRAQLDAFRRSCGFIIHTLRLVRPVCSVCSDIRSESRFLPTPPAFDAAVRGIPSECRHPVWYGKTKMAWLPDVKKSLKISLFVLTQLTNVTDTRTRRHRITA